MSEFGKSSAHLAHRIHFFEVPALAISSTDIRDRVRTEPISTCCPTRSWTTLPVPASTVTELAGPDA